MSDWGIQQWGGGIWLADNSVSPEADHSEHTEALPQPVRAHGGVQQQIQVRSSSSFSTVIISNSIAKRKIKEKIQWGKNPSETSILVRYLNVYLSLWMVVNF